MNYADIFLFAYYIIFFITKKCNVLKNFQSVFRISVRYMTQLIDSITFCNLIHSFPKIN